MQSDRDSKQNKTKILVTGGAGFLGINLIRYLLDRDISSITSLDIAEFDFPEKDRIRVVQGDIRDSELVRSVVPGTNWLVHAAAALPLYSEQDIRSTEVDGTRNLLQAALEHRVDRFVYISSTAVYGVPDRYPIYENDPLIGVGPYGQAKIDAEVLCDEYRANGLCIPVIRPKSFIGPERLGAFELLYSWAREGRGFPVVGSGTNRYQLLDVEDLCQAVLLFFQDLYFLLCQFRHILVQPIIKHMLRFFQRFHYLPVFSICRYQVFDRSSFLCERLQLLKVGSQLGTRHFLINLKVSFLYFLQLF